MSVTFTFNSEFLNNILSRTKTGAASMTEVARTGMAAVSVKASDTLASAKLRRAIDDLEDEIAFQMCAIGELVYATHRGTPSDSEELQKILEYVDDLHEQIEAHEHELKLMRGASFCAVCGAENATENTYCQDCGQPLSTQPFPEI